MQAAFLPDQIDAHRLLAGVATGRSTANFKNDQKIFSQGEYAGFVSFVQDGCVRLTTLDQGGENLLGIAQQGQFFGEACLHDMPVRLATATAVGDCRITSVRKEDLLFTIRSQPRFARMFIDYLAEQNSWTQKHLLEHILESKQSLAL